MAARFTPGQTAPDRQPAKSNPVISHGRLPLPLRREDREAGYDWDLSIWQMEVSLTQIFDRPLRGREFFEEIIRDNLDLERPDRVQSIFDRVVTRKTPGEFKTRVIQEGVHPSLHISYKNFDLKQTASVLS